MLRKLIALGLVAGLTKKAWDRYQANGTGKPVAANGNTGTTPVRRKVKRRRPPRRAPRTTRNRRNLRPLCYEGRAWCSANFGLTTHKARR